MGYCAGIMLAASVVGLILPATEMAGTTGWWQVGIGVLLGALFLNLLDNITPHLHKITGLDAEQHSNNQHINKVLLFVLAIAIHKLPEGIAAGVGFNNSTDEAAWSVLNGTVTLQTSRFLEKDHTVCKKHLQADYCLNIAHQGAV